MPKLTITPDTQPTTELSPLEIINRAIKVCASAERYLQNRAEHAGEDSTTAQLAGLFGHAGELLGMAVAGVNDDGSLPEDAVVLADLFKNLK